MVYRLILIGLFIPTLAWTQTLPSYKTTDNTGKGRQERFEAIEEYLIQVGEYSKTLEQRLQNQDHSALEKLKSQQDEMTKQIDQLKTENAALKQETQLLRQAIGNLSQTDFQKIEEFIQKLQEGEWDQAKEAIETLKLEMRSMEAVIQSLQQTPSRSDAARP